MDSQSDPFAIANQCFRRKHHTQWHRYQSRLQILRSQSGFGDVACSRPAACKGCIHYHGLAYGYSKEQRSRLICGFHPYGWQSQGPCPDWQNNTSC